MTPTERRQRIRLLVVLLRGYIEEERDDTETALEGAMFGSVPRDRIKDRFTGLDEFIHQLRRFGERNLL